MTQLISRNFGVNLGQQKRALVVGRLGSILSERGLRNFKEYYEYVLEDRTGEALSCLINRITTHHTYFNRESDHFDYFYDVILPELMDRISSSTNREVRIWCPGCSTGEEPYMLAMLATEFLTKDHLLCEIKILATDIAEEVLDRARKGNYSEKSVSRLPINLRKKYLLKSSDGSWYIRKEIKDRVLFRRLNLMRETFPFKRKFNVIFCRNVMIYFDKITRERMINRFHQLLEDEGVLFIGHAEIIEGRNSLFSVRHPAIYQKNGVEVFAP